MILLCSLFLLFYFNCCLQILHKNTYFFSYRTFYFIYYFFKLNITLVIFLWLDTCWFTIQCFLNCATWRSLEGSIKFKYFSQKAEVALLPFVTIYTCELVFFCLDIGKNLIGTATNLIPNLIRGREFYSHP